MRNYRSNSHSKYDLKVDLIQEYASFRKQFCGSHLWAREYMAISSGNITDELIQRYIEGQEGEPMGGSRSISN